MTDRASDALAMLERAGRKSVRDGYARYGIVAPKSFGVAMGEIQAIARRLGRDHDLAGALWASGWYEARLLASFVDDPQEVTPAQMDRWARDFDNWAVCDTVCFHLFDRTPHAFGRVAKWAGRKDEFVRRAAFALLASVALHDKTTPDAPFLAALPLMESAATDERNFVKKGVSWALRSVGRRSPAAHARSIALAKRLASADDRTSRWIGRDALRDLEKAAPRRKPPLG
jgi:3-methyladenine DNA glycosylase AlkD